MDYPVVGFISRSHRIAFETRKGKKNKTLSAPTPPTHFSKTVVRKKEKKNLKKCPSVRKSGIARFSPRIGEVVVKPLPSSTFDSLKCSTPPRGSEVALGGEGDPRVGAAEAVAGLPNLPPVFVMC